MDIQFRGIFAIPPTPFDEHLNLDLDGLRNVIDFCVESGAHGIVSPVNASEFTSLTDAERMTVVEVAANQNAGRLPFVVGVAGVAAKHAELFSKHARDCGANAVIAMPPYINKLKESELFGYYQTISDAAGVPVFLQNYIPPIGSPMSADVMIRLVREIEHVRYIKEETQYAGQVMTRAFSLSQTTCPGELLGIMGGKAGRYLMDEYRRGSCGNMPACEVADVHAQIWNALEAGCVEKAEAMFNQIIALLNFEDLYGSVLYKEVLKYRGVIRYAGFRHCGGASLDQIDRVEFNRIMKYIEPLFLL